MPSTQRLFWRTTVSKLCGKNARGCDQAPILAPHSDKPAASARRINGKAQFVSLGQGVAGKGQAAACFDAFGVPAQGQPIERAARYCAADPRPGQGRGKSIAHHHRLAMRFSEFLAVMATQMACQPAALTRHQRFDRQLHEIGPARDRFIQQAQRRRIDHVFGIVKHDPGETLAAAVFIHHQRRIKPVEAIGLGRRAVIAADDQP